MRLNLMNMENHFWQQPTCLISPKHSWKNTCLIPSNSDVRLWRWSISRHVQVQKVCLLLIIYGMAWEPWRLSNRMWSISLARWQCIPVITVRDVIWFFTSSISILAIRINWLLRWNRWKLKRTRNYWRTCFVMNLSRRIIRCLILRCVSWAIISPHW